MPIDYKTLYQEVSIAVKDHLIEGDALPPNAELATLARELTQVVFAELNRSGLTEEAFNRLAETGRPKAKAQHRA